MYNILCSSYSFATITGLAMWLHSFKSTATLSSVVVSAVNLDFEGFRIVMRSLWRLP